MGNKNLFENLGDHASNILCVQICELHNTGLKILMVLVRLQLLFSKPLHDFSKNSTCVLWDLDTQISVIRHVKYFEKSITQDIFSANRLIQRGAQNLGLLPVTQLHHLSDWGVGNHWLSWHEGRVCHVLWECHLVESLGEIYFRLSIWKIEGSSRRCNFNCCHLLFFLYKWRHWVLRWPLRILHPRVLKFLSFVWEQLSLTWRSRRCLVTLHWSSPCSKWRLNHLERSL